MLKLEKGRPANASQRDMAEQKCYDLLEKAGIEYDRVDHPNVYTMEGMVPIEETLGTPVCKNLFLCNRQKTVFYLLLMPGDKPFKTRTVSDQLGVARLSFANEEAMERLLGVTPGSVSVMGLLFDTENEVQLLIDEDLLKLPRFGCHPCRNSSTLAFDTVSFNEKLLPLLGHTPIYLQL